MAWSNTLFYIAFAGQIYLLSYYFPNQMIARVQYVLTNYPAETYPKLYPRPFEQYRLALLAFKFVTRCVLLIGVAILVSIMFVVDHSTFADDGYISEAWPAGFGILQFLPLVFVEFSEFSNFKQMRKLASGPRRTADLRRRTLTELVSPWLIFAAIAMIVGTVLIDLWINDFAVTWGHDTAQRAITLLVGNSLFAAIIAWNVYGQKLDPHQSADDRIKKISIAVKSLLYMSMAMSAFFVMTAAEDLYSLDHLDALLMTLYFQGIALLSLGYNLRNMRLDDTDFEVYKDDAPAQ